MCVGALGCGGFTLTDPYVMSSFGDEDTAALFDDQFVRRFQGLARRARRKLEALNGASNRRRITADTALRLSLFFANSPEFWLNLQTHYDLKMARKKLKPETVARIKSQRAA
jgi:plasmid maintenance system antidote protein VapI